MRIGHGYDVHRLIKGRPLILGGVSIPCEFGLLGHSDADVLAHALADALLGALALGTIGQHFPDTDEKYKGADSMQLLAKVYELVLKKDFSLVNADITLVAEAPKLAPFFLDMRRSVAKVLSSKIEDISVKATTEEGLGFTGRKEGIACHAVCLLQANKENIKTKPLSNSY